VVKENLLFDATPLFPERVACAVPYKLSDAEAALYKAALCQRGKFCTPIGVNIPTPFETCNFAKHLRASRWRTPFEAIAHAWIADV
jgi:hypothetical protein